MILALQCRASYLKVCSWCQSVKGIVARLREKEGIPLILPVDLGMQWLALSWESLEKECAQQREGVAINIYIYNIIYLFIFFIYLLLFIFIFIYIYIYIHTFIPNNEKSQR